MRWCRSEPVEAYLASYGIPFVWEESIPFPKINRAKGLANQNRMLAGRLDDDKVLSLAIAMSEPGAVIPGGVLRKNGTGYIPVDFNHRLAAFEESGLSKQQGAAVNAYVLETDDERLIWAATRFTNTTNGLGLTAEERVEHALATLDKFPDMTHDMAAKQARISRASLSNAVRAREAADLLRTNRVNSNKLNRTALTELSKLRNSEPAMVAAAQAVLDLDGDGRTAKDLVTVVKLERSEAKQLDAIEKFVATNRRKVPRLENPSSIKSQFNAALHRLTGIVAKNPTAEHLHLTSKSELDSAKLDWERLRDLMQGVFA